MSKMTVTRLLLETRSPMALSSGGRETGFDTQLARDVNGLPYLPATAIAGVWGHLAQERLGKSLRDKWFGTCEQSSSLVISNGVLVDQTGCAVEGLLSPAQIEQDLVLSRLAQTRPAHRERVAINDRGVAKDRAKFDQLLIPAGVRFSVALEWHDNARADREQLKPQDWQALLALWLEPFMAFGGSTRNGLGQVTLVGADTLTLNLQNGPDELAKLAEYEASALPQSFDIECEQPDLQPFKLASIPLQALDNWRAGTGDYILSGSDDVDMTCHSEQRLSWQGSAPQWQAPQAVLCGSSIKGILAHRVAFHLARLQGCWAEQVADDEWQQAPAELQQLFGVADDDHQNSLSGCLYVMDSEVKGDRYQVRFHNSIDRFTGGVRKGALYTEELLYQPELQVEIWYSGSRSLSDTTRQALALALDDLCQGLLPMGAGSGRGSSLVQTRGEVFIAPEFKVQAFKPQNSQEQCA